MGNTKQKVFKVGIIGGGVAGSTIAIRLAALGVQTFLFETKSSLIDGPPMCHLHAGGNLYREIPDEDCVALLKQSIDMLRMYPYSIDVRPTVIAIPKRDEGNPQDLVPRLELLTQEYRQLIALDSANKVLGEPEDYFHMYDREEIEALITHRSNMGESRPKSTDDWVLKAAQQLDLDKLKFPIFAVNEYGWNIFRLAASAQSALEFYTNAHLFLNTKVVNVSKTEASNTKSSITEASKYNGASSKQDLDDSAEAKQWQINYVTYSDTLPSHDSQPDDINALVQSVQVDYLINACGFRTGIIDNMVGVPAQRMVEFKASYVTEWRNNANLDTATNLLPEIIIHGKRGTPHGMVQLTPYPDGYYQIHSMNNAVTLFDDGLVATSNGDAQPKLKPTYLDYIEDGWNPTTLYQRSQRAIEQVSEFVPKFASAKPIDNALYGGQQIPGRNDTLRVADVRLYPELHYARAENVKASSALEASDDIVAELEQQQLITVQKHQIQTRQHHTWPYLQHISKQHIDTIAKDLARQRSFPMPMSGVVTPFQSAV